MRSFLISRCIVIAVFVLFASAPNQAHAQTGRSGSETGQLATFGSSVFGLGGSFSLLSGSGISIRQHFPGRFSYMVAGYVYKARDQFSYDYGIELQYDIILKGRIRFYALAGASYWYDDSQSITYGSSSTIPARTNTYAGPTRFGGGAGIETPLIGDDFCVSVSAALTSFQPVGDLIVYPYLGAHYYFR